jgi:enoyl-CoA hydratase
LFKELNEALRELDEDDNVGAIVITGSEKAFAAGADIKEMKDKECKHSSHPASSVITPLHSRWCLQEQLPRKLDASDQDSETHHCRRQRLRGTPAPAIPCDVALTFVAQLGGGCELAMMCDIILASPTATFGQPEINLGVIPGGGGTQRLARTIGKSKTMELVLTGRNFSAVEAEKWGLVSRVVEEGEGKVVEEAVKVASTIAGKGRVSVIAGKEAVNAGSLWTRSYSGLVA